MPEESVFPVSQSSTYITMVGNPPQILEPPPPVKNHHNQPILRSPSPSSGPRRTNRKKPSSRTSPYPSPATFRTKYLGPAPPKLELCILLGCKTSGPHNHPDSEIEAKIGWYPSADDFQECGLSAANEISLQNYLDARFPTRPFAYNVFKPRADHRQGSGILDSLDPAGIVDLRNALPEVENQRRSAEFGEPVRSTHNMDRALVAKYAPLRTSYPPRSEEELDPNISAPWSWDELLGYDVDTPHGHKSEEVVPRLGQLHTAQKSSNSKSVLTTTPSVNAQSQQLQDAAPDMRWKPCSMLDAYSTTNGTSALLNALPELPHADADQSPTINTTTYRPFPAFKGGPQQYHLEPKRSAPAHGNSARIDPVREGGEGSIKRSEGDVDATATAMEGLSIGRVEEANRQRREDPLREWFVKCGYIKE